MSQVLTLENTRIKRARCMELQRKEGVQILDLFSILPKTLVLGRNEKISSSSVTINAVSVARRSYDKISDTSTDVTQLKSAALTALSKNNIMVSSDSLETVKETVQGILEAKSSTEVTNRAIDAFRVIEDSHKKVFSDSLTNAICEAAMKVGFAEVKVEKIDNDNIRIVSTNTHGANLVTEINKTKIKSELIGISDGSCEKIIKNFDNELCYRGIVADSKTQKSKILSNKKRRVFTDEEVSSHEETAIKVNLKK